MIVLSIDLKIIIENERWKLKITPQNYYHTCRHWERWSVRRPPWGMDRRWAPFSAVDELCKRAQIRGVKNLFQWLIRHLRDKRINLKFELSIFCKKKSYTIKKSIRVPMSRFLARTSWHGGRWTVLEIKSYVDFLCSFTGGLLKANVLRCFSRWTFPCCWIFSGVRSTGIQIGTGHFAGEATFGSGGGGRYRSWAVNILLGNLKLGK